MNVPAGSIREHWADGRDAHVAELYLAGGHTTAEQFGVARSTIYRTLQRNPPTATEPAAK